MIGIGGFEFDKIGLTREDDPRKPDLEGFWQIMGEGQKWEVMAGSIAVDGRYAYTGQDIELTLLETKVVDLTPRGGQLDNNDSKMTHWPGWMKSASPARDPATQTDKLQFVVAWCANRRLMITESGFLGLVP